MNIYEIIALIFTILCVVLSGKQNILAWPSGIISVIALIVVYGRNNMYGQIGLQVIFMIQCIIGWYNWGRKDNLLINKQAKINLIRDLITVISLGSLFSIVTFMIGSNKNVYLVFLDGIGAFIGLLGNKYLTKKVIQAWPLFMFYNILMIILLLIQGIYLLVALNICLFLISGNSYISWRRILRMV